MKMTHGLMMMGMFAGFAVGELHAADESGAGLGFYEIQVVDGETGRGVPLVELETVNRLKFVTDNAGRVAFLEPGLMDREVFFSVHAHGYEVGKDGFGIAGARLKIEKDGRGEIKLKRLNVAERLYRITGEGLYRDSVLLGKKVALREPLGSGGVAGQDSVSGVPYRGKLYWFWGDTARMNYPLGLFRMAGATSRLPQEASLSISRGIDLDYFKGEDGFCRAMAEVQDPEGVVWLFGFATVPDVAGRERMVGHFSRRRGLEGELQHGMMAYDDEREIFTVKTTLPLKEKWRFLDGQPVKAKVNGVEYLYSGVPFPKVRVPATFEAVMDPKKYESLVWWAESGQWEWRKDVPPTMVQEELELLKAGKIKGEEARFLPEDAEQPGRRVKLHTGSVRWNEHRQRWVMIAVETAYDEPKSYPSPLGEVWYSEADAVDGPFKKAVRIVTHQKQTFYNPVHHAFFDEDRGRVIYFEGTYTNQFVDSPPTARYDYNQIMYRLDLDHPKVKAAFAP